VRSVCLPEGDAGPEAQVIGSGSGLFFWEGGGGGLETKWPWASGFLATRVVQDRPYRSAKVPRIISKEGLGISGKQTSWTTKP
jgi:hypothetical protein